MIDFTKIPFSNTASTAASYDDDPLQGAIIVCRSRLFARFCTAVGDQMTLRFEVIDQFLTRECPRPLDVDVRQLIETHHARRPVLRLEALDGEPVARTGQPSDVVILGS